MVQKRLPFFLDPITIGGGLSAASGSFRTHIIMPSSSAFSSNLYMADFFSLTNSVLKSKAVNFAGFEKHDGGKVCFGVKFGGSRGEKKRLSTKGEREGISPDVLGLFT